MTQDARFQGGVEKPLYIGAIDPADVEVLSAFLQDALVPVSEMKWRKKHRQLAVLLNRFRWEDKDHAQQQKRPVERVQSLLVIDQVRYIALIGIDRSTPKAVLALLSLSYQDGEGASEAVQVTFSGSAAIKIQISALEISLRDVTKPYIAPFRVIYLALMAQGSLRRFSLSQFHHLFTEGLGWSAPSKALSGCPVQAVANRLHIAI